MAAVHRYCVALETAELHLLGSVLQGWSVRSAAYASPVPAERLYRQLGQVSRVPPGDEACLSFELDEDDAEQLSQAMRRVTINELELLLGDADTADTASVALWKLADVIQPFELRF